MKQLRIESPKTLYRYRPLAHSWANTLTEITGMLWFSQSEGLNDPFDGLGYSLKYNRVLKAANANQSIPVENIWSVACFTTKWNNPTMWAHYANNYTGICLGYEKKELVKHVSDINKEAHHPSYTIKGAFLKPMEYVTGIPHTFKSIEEPMTIKTRHWEYEDEWRLGLLHSYGNANIKDKGAPYLFENALTEIIYTNKLKRNELITIKKIAQVTNHTIKFYKINIEKGMRVMTREEIA